MKSAFVLDYINIADKQRHNRASGKFTFSFFFILISKYYQLSKLIKDKKFDYIYTVFAPSKLALIRDVIVAFIIKRYSKNKLFAHIHCGNYGDNFNKKTYKFLLDYLIKQTDLLIFLSPQLNKINSLTDKKVVYLSNMISEDIICSDEEVQNKFLLFEQKKSFNICFVSNMIKEKGFDDLVEAIYILDGKTDRPCKVQFIGAWPSERLQLEFKSKLNMLNLVQHQFEVFGAISNRKKIKDAYLLADVFVLPTYYPIEAQPVSIIEAFNAATPVISTNHASIPDMINNGKNGFLVNKKSPEEIAERIKEIMISSLWLSMAQTARETYKLKYSKKVILPKLIELFA